MAGDLLMCIGSKYYPTVADFVSEAEQFGASKRIGAWSQAIEPGKTRCFVCHNDGRRSKDPKTGKYVKDLSKVKIIGYFTIDQVDIIFKEGLNLSELRKAGINVVRHFNSEPRRGCGYRVPGAMYVVSNPVSPEDIERIRETIGANRLDGFNIRGSFVEFTHKPYLKRPRFRGYTWIDGDRILVDVCNEEKWAHVVYVDPMKEIPREQVKHFNFWVSG